MTRAEHPEDDREQSFLEHLVELRSRLLKACLAVLIVLLCLLPFASIFSLVRPPIKANSFQVLHEVRQPKPLECFSLLQA